MVLNVSMTGTGSIGDIASGWSVNESVGPVAIGDASSGTGTVSFTSKSTDDSLLVINNDTVSALYTPDYIGDVHGIVQSVTQTGLNTSITHGTMADQFNLDCKVEPVEFGGLYGWLYNMYCAIGIQQRNDYFPVNGSGNSITAARAFFPMNFSSLSSDYLYSFRSFIQDSFIDNAGAGVNFFADVPTLDWIDGNGIATGFLPFMVGTQTGAAGSVTPTNSMVLQLKVLVNDGLATRTYLGCQFGSTRPSDIAYANCFIIDINSNTLIASVTELATETSIQYDLSLLDMGSPILFSFQSGVNSAGQMTIKMYVKDINGTGGSTSALVINNSGGTNWAIRYDSIEGFVDSINAFTTSITGDLTTYLSYFDTTIGAPYSTINFTNLNDFYVRNSGAFPATSGVAWELMQQLASAEHFEFAISGDTLIARSISNVYYLGSSLFEIENVASPPTISPTSTLSGRQINVGYNNAEYLIGVVYDAAADGNNVLSVEAGAVTVTSLKHNVNPISLNQPTRYLASTVNSLPVFTGPLPDGTYFVVDSTGLPISANQWEDYGGSLSVTIDPNDNTAIQVTLTGPLEEIPSTTGPYSLEANDGENSYAALSITGTGVYSYENRLELLTGIDTTKYTRAQVNTILNPFIVSEQAAYDRGVWAAQKASGPVVTFNATVPTTAIDYVGYTSGDLVKYSDSYYRITSNAIGNVSTSINGERCVIVSDMDSNWAIGITPPVNFTVSIASPAVFTSVAHLLQDGYFVSFTTTGRLPNNAATSSPVWGGWVINATANTFQLTATHNGTTPISTLGSTQSGVHSFVTGWYSVEQYDAVWSSYECQDQIIFPFKGFEQTPGGF